MQQGPVGDVGEHLGVHLAGRQAAHQVLCGGQFLPAVAAAQGATSRERWTQNQAARSGSSSSSSSRSARLVIFRALSRSPHSRPATAASAIRSR